MTMHLHHPSLSLSGKKKGKQKFRNADEARKSRELDQEWAALQKRWGVEADEKKRKRAMSAEPLSYSLSAPPGRVASNTHIKSLGQDNGVAVLPPAKVYTGDKILGIAVMHKSCLQPIFNQEAAKDSASMRR